MRAMLASDVQWHASHGHRWVGAQSRRGVAVTRASATSLPAFVFAPQLERGGDPALAALVRDERAPH